MLVVILVLEPAFGGRRWKSVLSFAEAVSVHGFLCCFQSVFWQSREQYWVVRDLAQCLRYTSALAVLPQDAHRAEVLLTIEDVSVLAIRMYCTSIRAQAGVRKVKVNTVAGEDPFSRQGGEYV